MQTPFPATGFTPPALITFTGADDATSIVDMLNLARDYPIEWGILLSRSREGTPRYPTLQWVRALAVGARLSGVALCAHLCGEYSDRVVQGQACGIEHLLVDFERVQVNTSKPVHPQAVLAWSHSIGPLSPRPILQCRGDFPTNTEVDWLYDPSGGRGIHPASWPQAPAGQRVGYAGGLGPANVALVASQVGQAGTAYWLDMESGVRSEDDRFCLDRCRSVCTAIWGAPRQRQLQVQPDAPQDSTHRERSCA